MTLPPVLLVHGFASSFDRNWRETGWVDLLADEGREVLGADLLGHAGADRPHDPAAYADLAGQVASWLPATGQVDAVGFSLGARTVLELAGRDSSRFRRIVVGGAGANVFADGAAPALADAIEAGDDVSGVMGAFVRFAHNPDQDPTALAACMRRPAPPLTAEVLALVTCPVLVVLGDKDFAGPAEPLVDALPDATFKSLRHVDHLGTVTDFGFLDATLRFLAG